MDHPPEPSPDLSSHLFTVRIWREDLGDDQYEWRGEVRHVMSGTTRYFREWSALSEQMLEMVPLDGKK